RPRRRRPARADAAGPRPGLGVHPARAGPPPEHPPHARGQLPLRRRPRRHRPGGPPARPGPQGGAGRRRRVAAMEPREDLHGVLVVDKPAGPTSHDVVDRVRRALRTRRAGHTGTLDPFASGVLPVCLGKATRLARFLGGGEEGYRATIRLGFATTTDDLRGEPLGPRRSVDVAAGALEEACRRLTGPLAQVPPAYSARRVGGRRLYELARRGIEVERE